MFEHDGCDRFTRAKDGWSGARPVAMSLRFEPRCEQVRRVEEATQRAGAEAQRADLLAAPVRALGVDPDEVE